jgi:hypothetical protein
MKVYDITLTCDHKLMVVALNADHAAEIAREAAARHGREARLSTLPGEQPVEVALTDAGVLVWYPGPFSDDAIIDEEPAS